METKYPGGAESPIQTPVAFLRLQEVIKRVALSRSELYRKVKAGDFPAPVKLSTRASAWAEHEIEAWCRARLRARGHAASEAFE